VDLVAAAVMAAAVDSVEDVVEAVTVADTDVAADTDMGTVAGVAIRGLDTITACHTTILILALDTIPFNHQLITVRLQ